MHSHSARCSYKLNILGLMATKIRRNEIKIHISITGYDVLCMQKQGICVSLAV